MAIIEEPSVRGQNISPNLIACVLIITHVQSVFEIKLLFCVPSGRTGSYNVHPAACPCTPLVYSHNNSLKKRAHTGRTAQKNVRPSTEMCALGAVCTLNFEHCQYMLHAKGLKKENPHNIRKNHKTYVPLIVEEYL